MAELVLLRGNLNQKALAQIPGTHPSRVKMLHQVNAAPQQFNRRGLISEAVPVGRRTHCELAVSRGQFFLACGQVPVLIQIADDQLGGVVQVRRQAQSSQLPRQVIGQSRRLGEKVLKRGLLTVFILRLCAIAGIKIILEVRSKIDLVERVLGCGRGLFRSLVQQAQALLAFIALLAAGDLIQHWNRFINLLQDGVFHHLGIDHLLQFELIQC